MSIAGRSSGDVCVAVVVHLYELWPVGRRASCRCERRRQDHNTIRPHRAGLIEGENLSSNLVPYMGPGHRRSSANAVDSVCGRGGRQLPRVRIGRSGGQHHRGRTRSRRHLSGVSRRPWDGIASGCVFDAPCGRGPAAGIARLFPAVGRAAGAGSSAGRDPPAFGEAPSLSEPNPPPGGHGRWR